MTFSWKRYAVAIFIVVFALDTWTKFWAMDFLHVQGIYIGSWIGIDLFLNLTTNQGAAWGVGASIPTVLFVLRVLVIVGLIVYLFSKRCPQNYRIPLCFALSGAISNVRDTLVWGHVIDMIDVRLWGYDFPVFNVADMAISLSVLVLFLRVRNAV